MGQEQRKHSQQNVEMYSPDAGNEGVQGRATLISSVRLSTQRLGVHFCHASCIVITLPLQPWYEVLFFHGARDGLGVLVNVDFS